MTTRENRRASWARIVQEQISSGQRVSIWCQEKSINEKTFRRWKRDLTPHELAEGAVLPAGWCQIQAKTITTSKPGVSNMKLVVDGRIAIEFDKTIDWETLIPFPQSFVSASKFKMRFFDAYS